MKRMILLIILGFIVLLVIMVAAGFWYLSTQPFYKPGMVRKEEGLSAPLAPPTQSTTSQAWSVEQGIDLAHFAEGEGQDVLVIHGGPGMPFTQPMSGLEALTGKYRFHYYDQRGCGESTRPIERFESSNIYQNMQILDRTLGLGAQIADIERIRRILRDEKLILIGHSWGGFLASLYAAEFPENIAALILVSPANVLVMPQPEADSDLFASVDEKLPGEKQAEFDAFMKEYMDFNALFKKSETELVSMNQKFGEYYLAAINPSPPEGDVSAASSTVPLLEQGRPGGWMVWAGYVSMGQRHDYRPALAQVASPVLVIHGANDLQSEAASRIYTDTFPDARFMVIDNAGHFSFEEQPEIFAQTVQDFLSSLK
jgi:proline iminopeptidase